MSKRIDKETWREFIENFSLFDNLSKINVADSKAFEDLITWLNKISENMKIKEKNN